MRDAETRMTEPMHLTREALEAGLEAIRRSPKTEGVLEMIVRRPATDEREVIQTTELVPGQGLEGDVWGAKANPADPVRTKNEITLMNARVIALLARERDRWKLAGDQFFVDLDLSESSVPAGTRLAVGAALVEVTEMPHLGCRKFKERFGAAALEFVNSEVGRELHLRGVNARIVKGGVIRTGDRVRNLGSL